MSFIKTFKYVKDMNNFNPIVVHIEYSLTLRKELQSEDSENLFDKKSIIKHYFFKLFNQQ